MKIDRVILSSNESSDYFDFWPIVSLSWQKIGIKPTLIYTGPNKICDSENIVNLHIPKIDSAFVSQNVRLLAPSLFKDEVCIISDIDDMPLSKNYFQKNIEMFSDDKFIIYRPDAVPDNMISIMWNVATGKTWGEIFNIENLKDIETTLIEWYPESYKIRGENWYFDQIILKEKIDAFSKDYPDRVVRLSDKTTGFNRLNRSKLKEDLRNFI